MASVKYFTLFFFFFLLRPSVSEPLTFVVIGGGIALAALYGGLYCHINECCDTTWIRPHGLPSDPRWRPLRDMLEEKVHGQHLAVETISRVVEGHLRNENPQKPLVLSLHGWTGTGKNFISELVATFMFKEGSKSKFIHRMIATHDFPHKSMISVYKDRLKSWIHGNVTACGRSLFLFDEMDKMPEGLVDVLKPFLDHYNKVGGTDFRKSIFIFLSNTGGKEINDEALKFWRLGKRREEITSKRMDTLLHQIMFNAEGGLWHCPLVKHHLVSYFIPFLPLERVHVKKCVMDDMRAKGYSIDMNKVDQVVNELEFYPEKENMYSKSGCKKVPARVDYIMG